MPSCQPLPLPSHRAVAEILRRVVSGQSPQQVRTQPKAPDRHSDGEDHAPRRPAPAYHRLEPGKQAESVGPDDVHEAVVVEPAADAKRAGEEDGQAGQRQERLKDGVGPGVGFVDRSRPEVPEVAQRRNTGLRGW